MPVPTVMIATTVARAPRWPRVAKELAIQDRRPQTSCHINCASSEPEGMRGNLGRCLTPRVHFKVDPRSLELRTRRLHLRRWTGMGHLSLLPLLPASGMLVHVRFDDAAADQADRAVADRGDGRRCG